MADLSERTIAIWAHCPWCPENAHAAVFPVQVHLSFEVGWKGGSITVKSKADTRELHNHVQTLHPDKVEVENGVCT